MRRFFVFFCALLSPSVGFSEVNTDSNKEVTIIAEDDWYPYSALLQGETEPKGLAVDIVREAYKSVGVKVNLKPMPYARCMTLVETGDEIGCFDTVKEPINLEKYIFGNETLFESDIVIYAPISDKSEKITLKGLEDKKVGVTVGYTYDAEFTNNKKILQEEARSDLLNFKKLAAGRIDYFVVYDNVGKYILGQNKKEFSGKFKVVGKIVTTKLYVNFTRKKPDGQKFLVLLDQGISKIKSNGTYKKLQEDWDKKLTGK